MATKTKGEWGMNKIHKRENFTFVIDKLACDTHSSRCHFDGKRVMQWKYVTCENCLKTKYLSSKEWFNKTYKKITV